MARLTGTFEGETLDVQIVVIVRIEKHSRPHLVFRKLLHTQNAGGFVVVVGIKIRGVEIAVVQHHQHEIVRVELAEVVAAFVKVQALHIGVEPHFATTQRGTAVRFEGDAVHLQTGQQIALRGAALHRQFREILVEEDAAQLRVRLQRHLDHLGLAVRVRREILYLRPLLPAGEVIFAVVRDARHVEALDVVSTVFTVTVHHIVNGALVVFLEHGNVHNLGLLLLGLRTFRLADVHLLRHTRHLVRAVAIENDHIVDVRAVLHKLVFLERGAHETVGAVHIEFLVRLHHFGRLDRVERANLGATRMFVGITGLDRFKPLDRHLGHVRQVVVDLFELGLDARNEFVGLGLVELQDTGHLDLEQAQQVVARHFAHEILFERLETPVDVRQGRIDVGRILIGLVFVDALVDEDAFQRSEHHALEQFAAADFQLATQQIGRVAHIRAQHFAHRHKTRSVGVDDAAVGRNAHLAIREGVEGVERFVARHARRQMDENFHLLGREILDLSYLDAPLVGRLLDAFAQRIHRFAVWQFGDRNGFAVAFLHACAHFHTATAQTVVVARNVDESARLEIGIEVKGFAPQAGDGRIAQLAEVMGQDLRTQPHGNAFGSLRQEQRELHRQGHRLLVAAVVGEFPLRRFGIEQHIEGKFRQSAFDVTRSGRLVAREDIAPRTLAVDEQVLTSHLGECIHDRRVAVRVKLHRFACNVRHLVVATVVHSLHRVENAALHGFQTVVKVRNGALQNHIGGIVQKPILVHPGEGMHVHLVVLDALRIEIAVGIGRGLGVEVVGRSGCGGIRKDIVLVPGIFCAVAHRR